MFRYMCGELQFLVGHRQCYLPSHALLQARRCYFACRESRRFVMVAEVWAKEDVTGKGAFARSNHNSIAGYNGAFMVAKL